MCSSCPYFLVLGWNTAIPKWIGDDIFVVQDDNGTLRRIQVKTATAQVRKDNFGAQFSISLKNLIKVSTILVHYIFVVRNNDTWVKPVIIRQDYLLAHVRGGLGSLHGKNRILYFSYIEERDQLTVICSGQDFTMFIRDFSEFPKIDH